MSKCIYCGEKAGLLSKKHKECEIKYFQDIQSLVDFTSQTILKGEDFENLADKINSTIKTSFIKDDEIEEILGIGYDDAIEKFLDDGILSKEEEDKASEFNEFFKLS